ncbi:hypothetical protein WJX84_004797 [Apatococcus fuscideae]|uniref:Intermembrane lipid transfer protein VPS13-like C-terminal domain-containing protein n=1 Tax=Apatococcus fuscideae TaxID=2026836 RepID=A0AAW1STE7_9CHLO
MCIKSLQVDNPLQAASYPVLCTAPATFSTFSAMTEVLKAASSSSTASALRLRTAYWLRRPGGVLCIERVQVLISPLAVEAEQRHLTDVAAFVRACLVPFCKHGLGNDRPPDDEPNLAILSSSHVMQPARQLKIYLEWMYISGISMTISFLPAARGPPAQGRLDRILALAGELEGGRMRLAACEMQHPLLGITALKQRIYAHYLRTALPEFIKLMGSSNLLGDPMRVVHHLGFGLYSFLMQPAAGFVSSRQQGLSAILHGLEEGVKALVSNVIIAVTNATAKATSQGRRSLAFFGLEQESHSTVTLSPQLQWHGGLQMALHSADPGLLNALLAGLVGVLAEPVRGFDEAGFVGLAKGILLGISGSITRPLVSGLEISGNVARSIRDAVMDDSAPSQRVRPPRFVTHMTPLAPYNWHEALGRCLAADVARGQFSRERFLACFQLAGLHDFVVLTHMRLLRILSSGLQAPPFLLGAVALRDILLMQRSLSQPSHVTLLILQQVLPSASLLSSLRGAQTAHTRPVMTTGVASEFLCFQSADDAVSFIDITHATQQTHQQPRSLLAESRREFAGIEAL